jgi:hypothetical protein
MFFADGTKMIVVGKERDLEEFKAAHPDVESGVLFVKNEIEQQISDGQSKVMIAYNAIGDARFRNRNEIKNLIDFADALKDRRSELNDELLSAIERFKTVKASTAGLNTQTGLDEKYLMEALKGFVTMSAIEKNKYSVETDVATLNKKYPLLINANFNTFSEPVFDDMLDYMRRCESR